MIKVYKIKIEDKVYEVEVEAITEKEGQIETVKSEPTNVASKSGSIEIEAPMQGVVISVDVTVGQKVKAGDTLVVLEAMKMENPIVASEDGTVATINVTKGQKVDLGYTMVTLS